MGASYVPLMCVCVCALPPRFGWVPEQDYFESERSHTPPGVSGGGCTHCHLNHILTRNAHMTRGATSTGGSRRREAREQRRRKHWYCSGRIQSGICGVTRGRNVWYRRCRHGERGRHGPGHKRLWKLHCCYSASVKCQHAIKRTGPSNASAPRSRVLARQILQCKLVIGDPSLVLRQCTHHCF